MLQSLIIAISLLDVKSDRIRRQLLHVATIYASVMIGAAGVLLLTTFPGSGCSSELWSLVLLLLLSLIHVLWVAEPGFSDWTKFDCPDVENMIQRMQEAMQTVDKRNRRHCYGSILVSSCILIWAFIIQARDFWQPGYCKGSHKNGLWVYFYTTQFVSILSLVACFSSIAYIKIKNMY